MEIASKLEGFAHGFSLGYSMIPVVPGEKTALVPWKEYQTRKPTEGEKTKWRKEYGYANPCLVCGRISGLIVLDLDGDEAHQTVLDRFGPLPVTRVVETPGGEFRRHYYYKYPSEAGHVHNFVGGYEKEMPGVDLRGDGGYVLYPGAVHKSGGRYQYMKGYSPDEVGLSNSPEWLVKQIIEYADAKAEKKRQMFVRAAVMERERADRRRGSKEEAREEARRQSYADAVFEGAVQRVSSAGSGGRNNALFTNTARLASLVAMGYLNGPTVEQAMEAAASKCGLVADDGMGAVRRTISSAFETGQNELFTFPERNPVLSVRPRIELDDRITERLKKAAQEQVA